MKELVEYIGKKIGVSDIHIHNMFDSINYNISILVKAEYKGSVEELIGLAIKYGTSYKLKREYNTILEYVESL